MARYINKITKISFLSLSLGLFSCGDELQDHDKNISNDSDVITISLLPESVATRSGMISDGSTVNRIYYAIYKVSEDNKGNQSYEIDEFYHSDKRPKEFEYSSSDDFTIKLIPDDTAPEDTEYQLVCWAQYTNEVQISGNTRYVNDYYDLSSFPQVKVKYYKENDEKFSNSDECRDAFYCTLPFKKSQKGTVIKGILTRPFAQINVGTSGWDYEGFAMIEPKPQIIRYSKITIKGVADVFNAFDGSASVDENNNTKNLSVEFDWAKLPSYRNVPDVALNDSLIITGVRSKDHAEEGFFTTNNINEDDLLIRLKRPEKPKTIENERVISGYAEYIGWTRYNDYCTESKNHEELMYSIFTETFKYLSMSYVLVPGNIDEGTTVEVAFDCSSKQDFTPIFGSDQNVFTLINVPAQQNYRTNIIAGNGTGFFMNANEMNVAVYSEHYSDYYKRFGAEDQNWGDNDDSYHGDNDNDKFDWPDDDLYYDFNLKLPSISVTKKIEWHPLEDTSIEFEDLYFYLDAIKGDEEEEYSYKVWMVVDGKEDLAVEKYEGSAEDDNTGKYKVTVPKEILSKMWEKGTLNVPYLVEVVKNSNGEVVSQPKSSSVTIIIKQDVHPWRWIFGAEKDDPTDNLKGAVFLDQLGTSTTSQVKEGHSLEGVSYLTASGRTGDTTKPSIYAKDKQVCFEGAAKGFNNGTLSFKIKKSCRISITKPVATAEDRHLNINYKGDFKTATEDTDGIKVIKATETSGSVEVIFDQMREDHIIYIYSSKAGQGIESITLEYIE